MPFCAITHGINKKNKMYFFIYGARKLLNRLYMFFVWKIFVEIKKVFAQETVNMWNRY